jgi:zinc-ribbon domain
MPHGIETVFCSKMKCRNKLSRVNCPMILKVALVTGLILVVSVLALGASFPQVVSQALTTVTTSKLATENVYSTERMGVTTQTATVTSVFLSLTDSVGGQGPYCFFDNTGLDIPAGTVAITGTIGPASTWSIEPAKITPIDFYIMTYAQFNEFQGGSCRTSYDAVVKVHNLMSTYSLNWKNPLPGVYEVVVFNEAVRTSFTVPIMIDIVGAHEQTSPAYFVVTGERTLSVPVTYVTTVQAGTLGLGSYSIAGVVGVVVVVAFVVAIIAFGHKLSRKHEAEPSEPEHVIATSDKQFCLECGAPLTLGSKYCNKCGAKQE